ncbi:uncharacterized protein LOC134196581 isoform X2 [Corticium candelabrum]|uniref:uncharacterized protein LOC134196581 isoform X2 n=1 Tax=Corticium candelabrum TaxID=121492 RepID=UPI002E25B7B4|nr:uncharacterized protein LOC134196581 isoform X2 [Corticium candelabrum]
MDVETTRRQRMAERRKARIQEVRRQEKQLASLVRENYQQSFEREREIIAAHLKADHLQGEEMKYQAAKQAYQQALVDLGRSHNLAILTNIEQANSGRIRKLMEGRKRAEERHAIALENLRKQRQQANQSEQEKCQRRKKVQLVENMRSMKVTAKPPPPQDIILNLAVGRGRRVRLTNVEGYSATYYHLNGERAHKETPDKQGNAFVAADQVEDLVNQKKEATAREQQERDEKARLRHHHACKEMRLKRDYSEMMDELAVLERGDRLHRQKMLQRLPKRVFVPPHRRMEEAAEMQREMERAFEEIAIQEECSSELNRSLDGQRQSPVLFVGPSAAVTSAAKPSVESTTEPDSSKEKPSDHETEGDTPAEIETPTSSKLEGTSDQDYNPMQKLLERVKAQRQAWTNYYQQRRTATSIPTTSSESSVNENEEKEEEDMVEEKDEEEVETEEQDDDDDGEQHTEETEEEEDMLTTACEEDDDKHELSVDYSKGQFASLAMPKKELCSNHTEGLALDNAVQPVFVKHEDVVMKSVTTDRAKSDGSNQHVPVSLSVESVDKEIDLQSVSYISPDDLLQHIHKQRKQYEDQRALMMSQYTFITDPSSRLDKSSTGTTEVLSSSCQEFPVLSHHNIPLVSVAGSVSQGDYLSISSAMSCSPMSREVTATLPLHMTSLYDSHVVAAPVVKHSPLQEHSVDGDSISHSIDGSLKTMSTGDQQAINTHLYDCNGVTTLSTLAKVSSGELPDLPCYKQCGEEKNVDVRFAGEEGQQLSHAGQLTSGTESQSALSSFALDQRSSYQQFSQEQELVALSSSRASSLTLENASQSQSQGSAAILLDDDGLEEQVHMPPAILLPSSSCHSPLSSDRHSLFSSNSGSLIDLSRCVDIAQAFQEPQDERLVACMQETDDMWLQEEAAMDLSTVNSTRSYSCQQQPWAFYLRTGIDPPQLENSNLSSQLFSEPGSFSDHSLPDFLQGSADVFSNGQLHQSKTPREEALKRPCAYSLQTEPDLSLLQSGGRNQGMAGEHSHSLSSGSQGEDIHNLHKGVSLQEAFARRKKSFVEASQARQQQIQAKSREREKQCVKTSMGKVTSTPLRSISNSTMTKKMQKSCTSSLLTKKTPALLQDKKALQKEHSQRNRRLYEKLPEVQQKRQEESRQAFYAANQSKAKLYSQRLRVQKQKNQE